MDLSPQPESPSKRYTKLLLKFVLVFGLLYFLAQKGFISVAATGQAFTQLDRIVPALALMLLSSILGGVRWQWLLKTQGIHLHWTRTQQLTFIGLFFNVAIPGAISGDVVKAFYVAREAKGKRAQALGSILFDRVVGTSALVIVSAFALVIGLSTMGSSPVFSTIKILVASTALGAMSFFAYLFLVKENWDPLLKFFLKMEPKAKVMGSFLRIYQGIRTYHNHKKVVAMAMGLSLLIHLLVGYTCYCFAIALGETLPLVSFYAVVPLGMLVSAIPIMPGGIGTGHAAFAALFKLLGSLRGADVFTMFALANFGLGGIGGLIYLRFKSNHDLPDVKQDTNEAMA